MRLLYYSTSYYANHGGSIQSKELYKNFKDREQITAVELFPDLLTKKEISITNTNWDYKNFLKKSSILQALFFYRRNQFYLKDLFDKIIMFKPDVILIQIDSNFLQIKYIKKRFPNLKICTQINGSPFDEPYFKIAFKNKFLKLQRNLYQLSDLNIFISDYSRNDIMDNRLKETRDVVIHNGTDVEKFYPIQNKIKLKESLAYHSQNFILGYVGTLDYHKKLDILIKAFADFSQNQEEAILVIIGDGPAYKEIETLIIKMNLKNKIFLKGWVDHEKINDHINCFDIAIHHYANAYMNPLKVFEYLSAGVPVIAPNIPSINAYFKKEKDLLITSGTQKDIYDKIIFLYNNPEKRMELSNKEAIIRKMENNFTWKNYSNRILSHIQQIL